MKKILIVLTVLALSLVLIASCSESSTGDGSSGASTDFSLVPHSATVNTNASELDGITDVSSTLVSVTPPIDIPKDKDNITSTVSSERQEYYPVLECGEFLGSAFDGVTELRAYFAIIDSYEELCAKTAYGNEFSRDIFEENCIVALYRHEGVEDIGRIGYSDFKFVNGEANITLHAWDADYVCVNCAEWKEIVYLQVPKAHIENNNSIISGSVTINRDEIVLYDSTWVDASHFNYENGTVWLLNTDELESFLQENNIDTKLNWKRYSNYSNQIGYKFLVVYLETEYIGLDVFDAYNDLLGYGNATVDGDILTVTREYHINCQTEKKRVFEFVAVPNEALNTPYKSIKHFEIKQIENACELITVEPTTVKAVVTEEKQYNYYNMLDLGIYYYDDSLPSGNVYHIITSQDELEKYVEKPYNFYLPYSFEDYVVVAIRMDGYDKSLVCGIRDLHFDKSDTLCAFVEYGLNSDGDLKEEMLFPNDYDDYCYILVPKSELDIDAVQAKGNLELKITDYFEGYYHSYPSQSVKEGYEFKNDSAWIITTNREAAAFYQETGISLYNQMESDKFLLVFYGVLYSDTYFNDFYVNGENAYINVVHKDAGKEYEAQLCVIRIDKALLNGAEKSLNLHMNKYELEFAKSLQGAEQLTESLQSFYASDYYQKNSLIKEPEFEWNLIGDYATLEQIVSEYTNIEAIPEIDFENSLVLAYYTIEPCTGCPDSVAFENVRVANSRMYIDAYKEIHEGGDAMTPCLYFITIPKEKVTEDVEKAILVKKDAYSFDEESQMTSSEYTTHIVSTIAINPSSDLKKEPSVNYMIIENVEDLQAVYEECTNVEMLDSFKALDFDTMCILAVYFEEGSGAFVNGGFKDLRVENNRIYIKKYYPQYEDSDMIAGDDAMHPTLHFIAVEKIFNTEEIVDVIVLTELPW